MATVHTAYGPGEIVDRETVRGRTQYKVAGDGFEVWIDEAKLGAYERPDTIDTGAAHWDGYDLGDKLDGSAFGPGDSPLGEGYDRPGFGLDDIKQYKDYLRHHDYYEGEDDLARTSSRRQAWAPLDEDNSTELPYDPSPQHDAVGQSGYDDGSSTIQPIHHIDADERTSPANSMTFEGEEDSDEPGPNPDLFGKRANLDPVDLVLNNPMVQKKIRDTIGPEHHDTASEIVRGHAIGNGINHLDRMTDRALDFMTPGEGWGDLIKDGSRHEANPAALLAPLLETLGPAVGRAAGGAALNGLVNKGKEEASQFGPDNLTEGWGDLMKDGSYRPAGLSDRYIDLTASVDYWNDPVAQFRHDPDAYINRIGHLMDEGLNPRFAEYMDLVEADGNVRTAAWKDVRQKAIRLKREGAVHVKDLAPSRIMASVDGDHGTYDVVILKGATVGDQSIANWHCGCEWGKWAFKRKFSYVGRLCSHAYASYLTMQSTALKNQPRTKRGPSDMVIVKRKPSERQYHMPVFAAGLKTADSVQDGPQRLTPDMVVNDTDDSQMFLDVTKDERKDTGPDDVVSEKDIVHFARVMAACEREQRPYPRQLVAFLARYAACGCDGDCNCSSDDRPSDYKAHDATDADAALNKLRADSDRNPTDDLGNMTDRVHRIQDAVEEARDNGADASQFVAMVKTAEEWPGKSKGAPRPTSPSSPGGSPIQPGNPGPPKTEVNTGGGRWPGGIPHTTPKIFNDAPGGRNDRSDEQTKMNRTGPGDGSEAPQSRTPNDPQAYSTLDDKGNVVPKGQTPAPAAPASPGSPASPAGPSGAGGSGGGGKGGAGGNAGGGNPTYTAPGGGQTSGNVADGGVAGAENGNNAAITKNSPGVDADGNYTVGKGDTWTDIAQRATGDMNNYQKMYDLNKGVAGGNIDSLAEGTKINIKDFLNDKGNGGATGDKTNPAGGGSDNNIATPEPVNTSAVGAGTPAPAAPGSTAPDNTSGSGTNPTPAAPPSAVAPAVTPSTPAPLAAEQGYQDSGSNTSMGLNNPVKSSSRRKAAPNATNPANPADPNQGQNGETNSTAPSTQTTRPGAGSTAQPGGTNSAPSSAAANLESDTFTDPTSAAQGIQGGDSLRSSPTGAGGTTSAEPGGAGGGRSVGDMIGTAGDMIGNFAPGIGGMVSGVGNMVNTFSDMAQNFGGGQQPGAGAGGGGQRAASNIFASQDDFDDWVRYAYPTAEGEGKLEPHTHGFAGSGWPGPLEIGTSEEYADKARSKADDVTDLGEGDLTKPMGDWQKQGSYDEATDDDSDIVRTFQAHLGETALGAGAGQGAGRFDDFASAAQGFLRTAGRNYSMAEQSELIREGDKGGARNLASLDLKGTHYEDMETLGW